MTLIPIDYVFILSLILFFIGIFGLLIRRNIIVIFICLEIMLNSSAYVYVISGEYWGQPDGQVMFILIMTVAAAEISIGLALLIQLQKNLKSFDIDKFSRLKG
ncbi:NADH-quinone oxidoreductase subunit NuoK [Candidatus Portiera aleyrodidarum]|uniref:NADH-quinone oxidoreductase subunit K n=1 Tax=Candidatus Portiera aleyrodidarum MED (Bemisia tabaci) TaxID=1163752 RepID=A0AAU8RPB8_9GAMM|nr:NADH-quinone oxidoreductase subunit NuoK [Candidatus Portiera aleyrodidarum]AFQ23980.1 NADH:ubiquinone oxidoreductase subunit 11 or 4L (chain K) [Candidatus Portiera aleyrodidarum BT-B-HRs]AFS18745.1 NADH-ubiquinone oxidoreductase chain K [Candidatus Portiera aleyrodidarum BT-QVLC]AFT80652.1 ADH-ubiquinone oxidoreductase chain K [Candidatus Portiera aleyrodidarum BT-B-HRs]AJF23959.1 NADH:ubiquinone oxidoreductase subunit K [Candidatus Portiera aleyrodidarum MED (Bemisia tabaci)]ASX27209.1 N